MQHYLELFFTIAFIICSLQAFETSKVFMHSHKNISICFLLEKLHCTAVVQWFAQHGFCLIVYQNIVQSADSCFCTEQIPSINSINTTIYLELKRSSGLFYLLIRKNSQQFFIFSWLNYLSSLSSLV